MKLEKIINLLGKVKNCNYVVKRVQEPHSTFKGFVTYTFELYYITDKPKLIFTLRKTISPLKKEQQLSEIEEEFMKQLFEYAIQ